MSIQASIDLWIARYNIWDILSALIIAGWTLSDSENITYSLETDDFSYRRAVWTDNETALDYLKKSFDESPIKSVCLLWEDSETGVTVIAHDDNILMFSININRKTYIVGNKKVTSFDWYVKRILNVLSDFPIEHISCEQTGH